MARSSQEIVLGMKARGLSYGQMGKLTGRDSGYFSQIARGVAGKGTSATAHAQIAALASRTARVKDAKAYTGANEGKFAYGRRQTAEGTPAKVRKGGDVTRGRTIGKQFHQKIAKAAREGRIISMSVTAREIPEYSDDDEARDEDGLMEAGYAEHGMSAETFLNKLAAAGYDKDPRQAFLDVMSENPHIEGIEGLKGYTLTISDRKGAR